MKHFEGFNIKHFEGFDGERLIDAAKEFAAIKRDPIDTLIPNEMNTTTRDARIEDLETVIIQQNILYTIVTLTTVTFLIVLANGR